MYYLKVASCFDAAHFLPNYSGACGDMHGHHWTVIVTWKFSEELNKQGIALDLKALKCQLREILKDFDHQLLNKTLLRPTAENLAKYIFDLLARQYLYEANFLQAVEIEETPGCSVAYVPGVKVEPAKKPKQKKRKH